MEMDKCPLCGCTRIAEGNIDKYRDIIGSNIIFPNSVPIKVIVCTNCGYILKMEVVELEKI